jgi:hypothetical protein
VPAPDRDRPRPIRPRRLRCEACLDELTLRHYFDLMTCSCGALTVTGRPARPTVHWLGRPGGGWSELDDETDPAPVGDGPDQEPSALRKLGFAVAYSRPRMAVAVEEIQPPVALTQARAASAT